MRRTLSNLSSTCLNLSKHSLTSSGCCSLSSVCELRSDLTLFFGLSFLVGVFVVSTVTSLLMVQGYLSSPSTVLSRNKRSR